MRKLIVDRIEENKIAICEADDGELLKIALEELPERTREGSVILMLSGGGFVLDSSATGKRIDEMLVLQDSLFDD